MRARYIIVGLFVGAFGIDALLGHVRPVRVLPTKMCADVGDVGMTVSLFLIPALFVFAPMLNRSLHAWRIPIAVLTSWYATLQFRMHFNLPALRELAFQRNDHMYDGVGLNAALLVMGWLPPLVVTIVLVGIAQLILPNSNRNDSGVGVTDAAMEGREP